MRVRFVQIFQYTEEPWRIGIVIGARGLMIELGWLGLLFFGPVNLLDRLPVCDANDPRLSPEDRERIRQMQSGTTSSTPNKGDPK